METRTPVHGQVLVATADAAALGERLSAQFGGDWNAAAGSLRTGAATAELNAWPDGLRIDAFAPSEAELTQAERAVDDAVRRCGATPAEWRIRPSSIPGAPPAPQPVYNFPMDDHDD